MPTIELADDRRIYGVLNGREIEGTVVRGLRVATGTLSLQIPLIAPKFPEIAKAHRGAINLQLDRPLRINNPHFISDPIRWHPQAPSEIASTDAHHADKKADRKGMMQRRFCPS
jgi:hypothetical protein